MPRQFHTCRDPSQPCGRREERKESPFTQISESNPAAVSLVETKHADCLALSRNCHAQTEVLAWCACLSPGSNVTEAYSTQDGRETSGIDVDPVARDLEFGC